MCLFGYVMHKCMCANYVRTGLPFSISMCLFGYVMHKCMCANYVRTGLPFSMSMCLFGYVMYELAGMVASAIRESGDCKDCVNSKNSLVFIYVCTLLIWSLFPVAWIAT